MFLKNQKLEDILKYKQNINPSSSHNDIYKIVYLINSDDEIVYIGKTQSTPGVYAAERAEKYSAEFFCSEDISGSAVNEYLAEMILEYQPKFNNKIPNNKKFISSNTAQSLYFVTKKDFKSVFLKNGGYKFGNQYFLKWDVFNGFFSFSAPFHKNMPKIGSFVSLQADLLNFFNSTSIHSSELVSNYRKLRGLSYEVVKHIDETFFVATNYDQKEVVLSAANRCNFDYTDGTWDLYPDDYIVRVVLKRNLELRSK